MPQNSFNVTSKHFINSIENSIVQLVKAIIVEHQVSIDEAKVMARHIVQMKLNQMLTDEQKKGIEDVTKETVETIKEAVGSSYKNYARKVYDLIKVMGFK